MTKLLLGFDCRQPEDVRIASAWDAARRERYLLREDVTAMSVDVVATPSVFAFDARSVGRALIHRDPADFHQQALGLWCSAFDMEGALQGHTIPVGTVRIAVFLCQEKLRTDQWWKDFAREPVEPQGLDDRWSSLGYDVANRYFTSALFNCGLDAVEKAKNVERWKRAINSYGLFEEMREAGLYRDYAAARLKDHGPFFVFQICQLHV